MRISGLTLLCCVVGCLPTGEFENTVASRRDPLPALYGTPGARLGTSVSACNDAGFLVGAPGAASVMATSPNAGFPTFITIPDGVGDAVVCARNSQGGLLAFAGGDGGIYQLSRDGGAKLQRTFEVQGGPVSIAALAFDGERLVIGAPPFAAIGSDLELHADAGPRFGSAVLRIPGFVLVGDPDTSTVLVFDLDGGFHHRIDPGLPDSGFGTALAFGVVTPGIDEQLLVGAPGLRRVFVFGLSNGVPGAQTLLPPFSAANAAGFGAAIALEPMNIANGERLDAVWVSAPDDEVVSQFVNGELVFEQWAPVAGSRFGAALTAIAGTAAVGAPELNGGNGAIYYVGSAVSGPGQLQACTPGVGCPINCNLGTCIGSAVCMEAPCSAGNCGCALGYECDQTSQLCVEVPDAGEVDAGPADAGMVDAGAPDAGPPDAGVDDAGTPDAGAEDAGKPDAGHHPEDAGEKADAGVPPDAGVTPTTHEPVQFVASGCSASPALMVLCLVLLFWRRRVTGS